MAKVVIKFIVCFFVIFIVWRIGNGIISFWIVPIQNDVAISQLNGNGTNFIATRATNDILFRLHGIWLFVCIICATYIVGRFIVKIIKLINLGG